jgi:hypothetical protein
MGVSDGRLPQEVLLEEFYRSECSETVQVGRVHVFEELLAVFNCTVLTFLECNKVPSWIKPRVHYNILKPSTMPAIFHMRFKILAVLKLLMPLFWIVTPCRDIIHLQSWTRRQHVFSKRWCLLTMSDFRFSVVNMEFRVFWDVSLIGVRLRSATYQKTLNVYIQVHMVSQSRIRISKTIFR